MKITFKRLENGDYDVHVDGIVVGHIDRMGSYDPHHRRSFGSSGGWDGFIGMGLPSFRTNSMFLSEVKSAIRNHLENEAKK
jgi:hypothetical protein